MSVSFDCLNEEVTLTMSFNRTFIFLVSFILASFYCNGTASLNLSDIKNVITRNIFFFLSDCTLGANKTRLIFYSRTVNGTEVDFTSSTRLPVDASLKTIFIVHGFLSDGTKGWINNTLKALLKNEPQNVFSVDWKTGACSEKIDFLNIQSYKAASANTEEVAEYVTECIKSLVKNYGLKPKNIWMIGHSLGAHVCGFVGKYLKNSETGTLGRITGLDPAGPLFRELSRVERLDRTDASFVEIIHTSKIFGLEEPIGHIDVYVNGGDYQPSCFLKKLGCSHDRSVDYYLEAIKNPSCLFKGRAWSRRSGYNHSPHNCTRNSCTVIGPQAINYSARGTFAVVTNQVQPYCTGKLPVFANFMTEEELVKSVTENLFDAVI